MLHSLLGVDLKRQSNGCQLKHIESGSGLSVVQIKNHKSLNARVSGLLSYFTGSVSAIEHCYKKENAKTPHEDRRGICFIRGIMYRE